MTPQPFQPTRFDVLVNTGFRYEYQSTIEAKSVAEARSKWKARGDWMAEDFRVRRVKDQGVAQ